MVFATAYPRIRVSAYPLHTTFTLLPGEGWSSPLRICVSAYPLSTTLTLFLGEGWSSPLRIRISTSHYIYITSRGGVVFATSYSRIRVSTLHYTYIISRKGVVFATAYPCIRTLQGSTFDVTGYSAVTPWIRFPEIYFIVSCSASTDLLRKELGGH